MSPFVNRYATPLTTGLFAVSAISGVALFVHVAQGAFHEMHEWLSMLLLVPFGLHLWKNWRGLTGYAARGTLLWPLLGCLAIALAFAAPGLMRGGRGGNPGFRVMSVMTKARIADLAPLLHTTPAGLVATLRRRGYAVQSADQSLDAVAAAAHKNATELLFPLLPAQ